MPAPPSFANASTQSVEKQQPRFNIDGSRTFYVALRREQPPERVKRRIALHHNAGENQFRPKQTRTFV